jgi:Lipoxygenase
MATSSSRTAGQDFSWELKPDYVPPHVQDLPKGHGFSTSKIIRFDSIVAKAVLGFILGEFLYALKRFRLGKLNFQRTADLGLADMFKAINEWHRLEDFDYFYKPWTSFTKPRVADSWDSDLEFGRARLYGVNPAFIRQCRPEDILENDKFPVSETVLADVLPTGKSLLGELHNHRLYFLDYKILNNILTPELEDQLGKYAVAPLCLLHVNDKEQLMPIAIQLKQGSSLLNPDANPDANPDTNPVLTPQSSPESWLTAKVAVSSADIAYQGIISHLLNTHLVIETFAVSTYRQLPTDHLVFQLLCPHFFNTFAINEMARGIFLGHNGFFDVTGALGFTGSNELLERAYLGTGKHYTGEPYSFYQTSLPRDLKRREVETLPGYHYRDDALLIWDAIQAYVREILSLKYQTSDDLIGDQEIQNWKTELVSPDLGRMPGLLPPEKQDQLNGKLSSIEDLAEILTNVIFTATAQHSAVNFGQYEYAGWVPNMPFALYQPLQDVSKNHPPATELVKKLPDRVQTIKQMTLVKALSLPIPHSSPSLLTMKNPFRDNQARKVFQTFQQGRLQHIEQKITQRNASAVYPYVRLLPSKIAQSIAI